MRRFMDFFFLRRKICIDSAIRGQPYLLGCSTSKLKSMLDQLADLGVKGNKLDRVIARSPQLLLQKPRDFLQVVLFFENMGLDREIVGKFFLAASINKTLKRKIEFLSDLPGADVPDEVRTFGERDWVYVAHVFSAPRVQYRGGFEVKSMERPVREVVDYPRYFSYSLEKKIKPRYFVLKGRHIECSLKDMLGKNYEEFAAEFMGVGLGGMLDPPLCSENVLDC
ncbi:transcription termination factor MTERF6, chloroplastic/mitochondrial-like isoform X2 [Arachis stenosperma]|uniref:transcription termination factor MTERF6, chloroplastic/mitochondrial-like isoform X2 n=1 Tax=Arachis stenosperma TaxID=217475 RepID=UPI0025AC14A8|nr:transcription termination factor MTERF6, chloroplastic/mitochondrial-like isoform X2 [Arachis stenosperma]